MHQYGCPIRSCCPKLVLLVIRFGLAALLLSHMLAAAPVRSAAAADHGGAAALRADESVAMRLKRRSSLASPVAKTHGSILQEAVRDALEMDAMRLKEFQARVESSVSAARSSPSHESSWSVHEDSRAASTQEETAHIFGKTLRSTVIAGASVGSGQYFVTFRIGTPSQEFQLIADTGSDLVWVRCACERCERSHPQSPIFNSKKSTTFSPIPCLSRVCPLVPKPPRFTCKGGSAKACRYDYVYADLSDSSGVLAYETATLNTTSRRSVRIRHVAFGCGFENRGNSFQGSGGVLGLGRGSISFVSQIGSLVGHTFSYCFVDFFRTPAKDSLLVFGKRPEIPSLHAPFQYTSLLRNPVAGTFYYIGIQHLNVNGKVLRIRPHLWRISKEGNGGVIIDSGTTLTYFLDPAYRKVLKAFKKAISYPRVRAPPFQPFDLCFNTSGVSHLRLPLFSITFQGNATFQPPPANYFVDVGKDVKCLGLQGVSSPYGFSVIGNLLQQNFHVEYDRQNERLGFAPTICSAA